MYYIGSDHRGFSLKKKIVAFLREKEITVKDLGANKYNPDDDYVDFGLEVAKEVVTNGERGILICRSGIGMSVIANKVSGVRAGLCFCLKQARLAVEDNNINILCLSADLIDEDENIKIVKSFIDNQFVAEERHIRRINKIKKYEALK